MGLFLACDSAFSDSPYTREVEMFTRKTVFVVGAGGSFEVNLPTGPALKSLIATKLKQNERGFVSDDIREAVGELIATREGRTWEQYKDAALKVADAMPASLSIDNFLHSHSHDEVIVEMGKLAISACILEKEQTSKLGPTSKKVIASAEQYWANTFCKILTEGVQVKDRESLFDNVTIITFNYDRCIEYFVVEYLKTYFLLSSEEAHVLARKLKVLHPYGQVGNLKWNPKRGYHPIPFGSKVVAEQLVQCIDQIHTFTEQATEPEVIQDVHNAISSAERVVFLGFAYHDLNMQLLIPEAIGSRKDIYGTAFGLSDKNVGWIHTDVQRRMTHTHGGAPVFDMSERDIGCNQFLLDYWRPIFN